MSNEQTAAQPFKISRKIHAGDEGEEFSKAIEEMEALYAESFKNLEENR